MSGMRDRTGEMLRPQVWFGGGHRSSPAGLPGRGTALTRLLCRQAIGGATIRQAGSFQDMEMPGHVQGRAVAATRGIGAGVDRLGVDPAFDAAVESIEYGANRRLAVVSGRQCGSNRQVLTAAAVAGAHDDRNDHPS